MPNSVVEKSLLSFLSAQADALAHGQCRDPFAVLGAHQIDAQSMQVRAYLPTAQAATLYCDKNSFSMNRVTNQPAFFCADVPLADYTPDYTLGVVYDEQEFLQLDPYRFSAALDNDAAYLFNEGNLEYSYRHLGAHFVTQQGVAGVRFCVWAPNAKCVAVIGEFNGWNYTQHPMRLHPASGIWELFIPALKADQAYKFSILRHDGARSDKADPYAFKMQQAPGSASLLQPQLSVKARDDKWLQARANANHVDAPISIYEVHLGSWKRLTEEGNRYLTYRELADDLVGYVKALGFTHIQLMPISEYPFDGSWGYQPVGMFAPTSRFGSYADFIYFVEACQDAELGLLIDWVPGHFPSDPHGLHLFDGTHLYEHADKRQGFHPDWNTYIYNYDRPEVQSFLLGNAMYWLQEFKLDGLRVDAVASMLYLDYSRKDGEWVPNCYGGRENLGAIACLKKVNARSYGRNKHIMMVAEESTAWPSVTGSTEHNGLGFGYKWNMGWMNDTLSYMHRDPVHRKFHHHEITFSMAYAYSENYILPLSHDEVVHGKGALLSKMPGDDWQQFANLRAYYAFMFAHPGKKLLFMGSELAPREEWNHNLGLNWSLLDSTPHRAVSDTIRALNHVYRHTPALYENDTRPAGFQWIDCHNSEQSIISFARFGKNKRDLVVVVAHFTPEVYHQYRLGVPEAGHYEVVFNSDSSELYGSGTSPVAHPQGLLQSQPIAAHGFANSIEITIGPLCTVYFRKLAG
ncbi:1,4-alpha-glucan branching protein GlgB [Pseudoalteromonas fenneropenaei]|uniref:1,4-alpha-glucan branching enzyme GlgB n=1 Tax=Pseudoalteromonas fenneropenaei TaxID=1737459 RepID=A0ABV7CME7_9GAMM